MKCPKCSHKTIAFGAWCRKPNAFRWICPHCQAPLKANRLVLICFWLSILLGLGAVLWVLFFVDKDGATNRFTGKALAIIVAALVAAPLVAIAWFKGGYKSMER